MHFAIHTSAATAAAGTNKKKHMYFLVYFIAFKWQ